MNLFKQPTAQEIAERELEAAKCKLLEVESQCEYWEAMRFALKKKITRLSGQVLVQIEEKTE